MRWTVRIGVVLTLLIGAYAAWPFVELFRLAWAIETRDFQTLERGVDVDAVRRSVMRQVLDSYLALSGKDNRIGGVGRDVIVGAVASATQPALADVTSAERILDLLRQGWPRSATTGAPSGKLLLIPGGVGDLWRIFADSEYGIRTFVAWVPPKAPMKQRFGLRLRLVQWRWRLNGVELPEELRVRLAQEMIKASGRRSQP